MAGESATAKTSVDGVSPEWRRAHAGSGLTSVLILAHVEREGGREAAQRMLEHAGLAEREQELRDESAWFSFETKIKLWAAAEAVTGTLGLPSALGSR